MIGFAPLSADRWDDLEELFGRSGAYGGCWCMWWRLKRKEFEANGSSGNRKAFKTIVTGGRVPGILAYEDQTPVGWCAVAPRSQYGALNRSPVLKPLDDLPVWSITCFYVAKAHQGKGLMLQLIEAAKAHVKQMGGNVVEAYPTCPRSEGKLPPVSSYMGLAAVFTKAGFYSVANPSKSKQIMRCELG
jgi:GNAT superfamily N-acetyltransferase|tara:strand:- start:1474 stop:2037 length:564 start_codon:yes stop_codon:yes gene_type:complete